jgi:hypothetical protein
VKCILCVMLAGSRNQVRELVLITLAKDHGGVPFLSAQIAMCEAHGQAVGVVVEVTKGTVPDTILYGADRNFFAASKTSKSAVPAEGPSCASCGHEDGEHDGGEQGSCGYPNCECLSFESLAERVEEQEILERVLGKAPLKFAVGDRVRIRRGDYRGRIGRVVEVLSSGNLFVYMKGAGEFSFVPEWLDVALGDP